MKDLEKIKSEDLAAQVQDANPANFAIEQEVAALVGATVPQPTQPSADDARELGAQLLVFLRRALLPIQTALRTAVAAIYAHLDSRCTDYTPAAYAPFRILPNDPMRPFVPRTLPNLLTALTAFDSRKISNGSATADGIPDGIGMLHLLCNSSINSGVVVLGDDDSAYEINRAFPLAAYPEVTEFRFSDKAIVNMPTGVLISGYTKDVLTVYGIAKVTGAERTYFGSLVAGSYKKLYAYVREMEYKPLVSNSNTNLEEIYVPELLRCNCLVNYNTSGYWTEQSPNLVKISAPKLKEIHNITAAGNAATMTGAFITSKSESLTKIELPELEVVSGYVFGSGCVPNLTELRMPKLKRVTGGIERYASSRVSRPNLGLIEVGAMETNLNLNWWNPTNVLSDADKTATFLQNFKEHIALRLTSNGSGLTLTLSQAVFSAVIEGSSPICDDIKGIIEDKGWKVQDTNNNIFPTT